MPSTERTLKIAFGEQRKTRTSVWRVEKFVPPTLPRPLCLHHLSCCVQVERLFEHTPPEAPQGWTISDIPCRVPETLDAEPYIPTCKHNGIRNSSKVLVLVQL